MSMQTLEKLSLDELVKHVASAVREVMLEESKEFFNQAETGVKLGHSADWMRLRAKEHALFRPSIGEAKMGTAAKYHRVHIEYIARHLLDPAILSAESALLLWESERRNWISDRLEATKPRKKIAQPESR